MSFSCFNITTRDSLRAQDTVPGANEVGVSVKDGTWLTLCDGFGCAALAGKDQGINPERYIAVELDASARRISQSANPESDVFCGVDHSWKSDVMKITREDIEALGRNSITFCPFGAPCQDLSMLRKLPPRHKNVTRMSILLWAKSHARVSQDQKAKYSESALRF